MVIGVNEAENGGAMTREHEHAVGTCPECFVELQRDGEWWRARPEGARLVGLVVARDDLPPIVQQRADLAQFGVSIHDFRHPAPETHETWEQRLERSFGRLERGDVLVVANRRALGRAPEEEVRTIASLRSRGVVVKVLRHGAQHLAEA